MWTAPWLKSRNSIHVSLESEDDLIDLWYVVFVSFQALSGPWMDALHFRL